MKHGVHGVERRGVIWVGALLLALVLGGQAFAELEQVSVGGEMRIRGRYYINTWAQPFVSRQERVPVGWVNRRPVGGTGVSSLFSWDNDQADWTRYETALKLHVKADFTDNVTGFIEFYDFHIWGEDFRSRDYITGLDTRAVTNEDIEVEQGYIEARNMWGTPLSMRVGRQEIVLGKGWLVTNLLTPSQFVSHDAIRLTYNADDLVIDAFWSKLFDNISGDDDIDFYGVYGTYSGFEPLSLSAYWLFLRDGREVENVQGSIVGEWLEDLWDLDNYGHTNLHTVGLRAFGKSGGFDYDLELAYQFGDADTLGARFVPIGGLYGDTDAEYDHWAADLTVGYTFAETPWKPRVYLKGAYFDGDDNRDISFLEWLNPFYRPEASVAFNRLFSDKNYMPVVNDNGWMSNFAQIQAGVEVQPLEKVRIHLHGARDWVVAPFDFPVLPGLPFWTREGSDDIGWEVAAWLKYDYSDSLWFLFYGNYLWVDDGLTDGAFVQFNGTDFSGGSDDDDAGYVFWMAVLKF